jgi:DNA-binding LytR/AlgR family response regulator
VRIHRSYLLNLDRVREIRLRRGDPNDWEVKLDRPVNAVLPISRRYYAAVLEYLER